MAEIRVLASLSIGGRAFPVLRYDLDEQLSELGRLECDVFLHGAPLPRPLEVCDKPAVFTLTKSDDSQVRTWVGTVVSAELAPDADDVPSLRLEIAPTAWNLCKRADCRIFQKKTAIDIVKEVLTGAGVPSAQQDFRLGKSHPERVYTVQYRETDFDFIRRLLAEEGVYFAIHTKDEKDVLVFGDAPDGLGDVEGTTTLPFFQEFGFESSADRVLALSSASCVRSDKVFVRDYNPEKPSLKIEASVEGTDPGGHALEVYDYPARATDVATAKRIATALLESIQADRDLVQGETGSLALLPGLRFSVDGHPYDPMNRSYMVVRSRISGSQPRSFETGGAGGGARASQHTCEFWAVPTKTTRYSPPRRPRDRIATGLQTAITTGAPGEEIHTDKGGHVKVSFPWDRSGKTDDTSSCWMRTSQAPTGGSMLLPRVGWEVTLCHLEGDVDRPLVMGRVYNTLTAPPYALPAGAARSALQTATTPGGGSSNELRTTDTKGSEEMFFNASKDMTTVVENNATESIGNDKKKKVGSSQAMNVTDSITTSVGANQTIEVSGNQTVKVETFHVDEVGGNHSLTIGGNRDMKVGGDHKRDVGGTNQLEVGGNHVDLVVGSITNETLASFSHKVGAALVELAVGDRTVTVAGAREESAGAAKVIAVKGGRGVQVGGSMNVKVAGAIVHVADGDRAESAGGNFTELATGAQLVKANNVVFEADTTLTLVMGASVLSLTPASVSVMGTSAKLDGDVSDTAAMVVDN